MSFLLTATTLDCRMNQVILTFQVVRLLHFDYESVIVGCYYWRNIHHHYCGKKRKDLLQMMVDFEQAVILGKFNYVYSAHIHCSLY